jgi:hypothetical protein
MVKGHVRSSTAHIRGIERLLRTDFPFPARKVTREKSEKSSARIQTDFAIVGFRSRHAITID